MRLICPNCGAQYEVEEQVIPEAGRDVQCSNCGHTWFQRPAHLDEELAEELGEELPQEAPGEEPEEETPEPEEEDDEGPQRRGLDPEVTNVLREEAAREAEARRGEKSSIETQPDLGLDDAEAAAAQRSAAARARMARLRGREDDATEEPGPDAPRKDLLPDIDEINDTLRAEQDRDGDAAMPEEEIDPEVTTRRGFRRGFFLILLIAAVLALVYAYAPLIAETVPAVAPYLDAYVDWVNSLRGPLNAAVQNGLAKLTELVGGLTGGE